MTHAPMCFANHDAIEKTLLKNLCKKKLHKDCEKFDLGPINNIYIYLHNIWDYISNKIKPDTAKLKR